jgi:hypothetical protein
MSSLDKPTLAARCISQGMTVQLAALPHDGAHDMLQLPARPGRHRHSRMRGARAPAQLQAGFEHGPRVSICAVYAGSHAPFAYTQHALPECAAAGCLGLGSLGGDEGARPVCVFCGCANAASGATTSRLQG